MNSRDERHVPYFPDALQLMRQEVEEFVADATPEQFGSTLRKSAGLLGQSEVLVMLLDLASPEQLAVLSREDLARLLASRDPDLRTAAIRAVGKLGFTP